MENQISSKSAQIIYDTFRKMSNDVFSINRYNGHSENFKQFLRGKITAFDSSSELIVSVANVYGIQLNEYRSDSQESEYEQEKLKGSTCDAQIEESEMHYHEEEED